MIYLTRRYDFCASHRLYNPEFSDEKNWEVFGKCNNPNGHGHNYELEVTVKGNPDQRTGLIIDLAEFDRQVHETVITPLDHKNLNQDVAFMANTIPTSEHIVMALWNELEPNIPKPAHLHKLRLMESRNNYAEYLGPKAGENQ